ncbi:hypothetical protein KC19_5G100600 [Ceratodon purpureus]|uniref:Uncharacterized protein n=1 Tax=Ceratodon purpureus TaxID=3225 RepID=A0A8T0I0P3_CERPU|nr:hypothetical protein KC19_5G100600 [Ceratodon purpureus]
MVDHGRLSVFLASRCCLEFMLTLICGGHKSRRRKMNCKWHCFPYISAPELLEENGSQASRWL